MRIASTEALRSDHSYYFGMEGYIVQCLNIEFFVSHKVFEKLVCKLGAY